MARKTNYPTDLRQFILNNVIRFCPAVVKVIKYHKNEKISTNTKITGKHGSY